MSLAISLVIGVPLFSSSFVKTKGFKNGNTESNLLVLGEKKNFDFLLLGNSHARNFSRHQQHQHLEKSLGGSVLNLGQGRGICGINDQYFYLKYLLTEGYTFKKVIHVVSPPYLFDDLRNQVTTTFFEEPFCLKFLYEYLKHPAPNKTSRLVHYIKTKWKPSWLKLSPNNSAEKLEALDSIDLEAVQRGFKIAHPNGLDEQAFIENKKLLEKSIQLAFSKGISTYLVQTPTLFEAWPGQDIFNKYCNSLASDLNTPYIDLGNAIDEPQFFYDHHHLNTAGIKMLLPIFRNALDQHSTNR